MTERQEEIRALKAGDVPAQHRLVELRSRGMHAIRFEFVVRLLHAALREDTLSIFWDHDSASLRDKPAGDGSWRLVLGRGKRAAGDFPDLWVMCYPDDPETRQLVDATLDRMVERVRAQFAREQRTRGVDPTAMLPRLHPGGQIAQRRDQ